MEPVKRRRGCPRLLRCGSSSSLSGKVDGRSEQGPQEVLARSTHRPCLAPSDYEKPARSAHAVDHCARDKSIGISSTPRPAILNIVDVASRRGSFDGASGVALRSDILVGNSVGGGGHGAGRGSVGTAVEVLRERLERLSWEGSARFVGVECAPAAPNVDWLPGQPFTLDRSKCAHNSSIAGMQMVWPFEPLHPQVAIADRLVRACRQRQIAVLESPTGTGKSIALLTAALSWQQSMFESHKAAPQIIYAVRTHAQLSQMVHELRKSPYRPRMALIGSRDHLCINREVKALAAQQHYSLNLLCRQATRRSVQLSDGKQRLVQGASDCTCDSYVRLGSQSHARNMFDLCGRDGQLWDVEDLVHAGSASGGGCPYYTAHVLAGPADIIFCPHNYVLDPAVSQCRSHHRAGWSLKERVIILDEAHNIEQGCRDAGSIEISLRELRDLTASFDGLLVRRPMLKIRVRGTRDLSCPEICAEMSKFPRHLETFLVNASVCSGQVGATSLNASYSHSGKCPSGLCQVWGLPGRPSTSEFITLGGLVDAGLASRVSEDVCLELTDRLLRWQTSGDASAEDVALLGVLGRLHELLTKLRLAVAHAHAYVVGISTPKDSRGPIMAFWLMSPGVIFETFASQAHAVILASGTLAPVSSLYSELSASVAYNARIQPEGALEAAHIVGASQLLAAVLTHFPCSGRVATSTFESWKNLTFLTELGDTLTRLAEAIPHGVLCFLPSYAALEACSNAWRSCSFWNRLNAAKGTIIFETKGGTEVAKLIGAFAAAARGPKGALCFAVYRGKVSEGLSFDDELCRGVICVGVPYPQIADPVVVAKRSWNDACRSTSRATAATATSVAALPLLSGDEWYELQGYRAVNQALGRCIRHHRDYGALILLDARWAARGDRARCLQKHLARWLRPFVEEWSATGISGGGNALWEGLAQRLQRFFVEALKPATSISSATTLLTSAQALQSKGPGVRACFGSLGA